MRKFYNILLSILILGIFIVQPAIATDTTIPVRIGISNTSFKTYSFNNIIFNNANFLEIMDSTTGYTIKPEDNKNYIRVTSENNLFSIYIDNNLVAKNLNGPILIRPKDKKTRIEINGLKRKGIQAAYRGYIELVRSSKDNSKFHIVNVLSLRNYLRGVVPNEMPVRFGLEALKAQTVAARNYAITPRVKAYKEFDMFDSVSSQVYFGANTEDPISDQAILETNGVIALDKEDMPILALYSSTAGGFSESYKYAFADKKTGEFPANDIHYLTGVPDVIGMTDIDTEEKAEEFYTTRPESFDDESPYYRWSREWDENELEKVLAKTLISQSKTGFIKPALTSNYDFGILKSIQVLKRGKSGKVVELEIITNKNTFYVQKELVIRRCFQKNGKSLPSANFVISKVAANSPVYKFNGGGFGHGVGLSQWGAGKMSSLGMTFDQILQHYYQGIKLATIPIKVYANGKHIDRTFYSITEDATLVIKNPCNLDKLKIIINNKEHTIKLKKEVIEYNISKHFNEGENKISFEIIDEDATYQDYIEAFVIVKEAEENE